MSWPREIFHSILKLGAGEIVARLSSFVLVAYISRNYGLELLGTYALAQTVALYVMQGTDQGFRLIGARIVARDANLSCSVVPLVSRNRLISGAVCLVGGIAYSAWGPMPNYARICVAGLTIAILPYALSLDWLAWGLSHFGWLGSWRAGISIALTTVALLGFHFISDPRISLVCAHVLSAAAGSVVLWVVWLKTWKHRLQTPGSQQELVHPELRWGPALSLGLATILTQMFHNFDTVLLGAMAPLTEVGRYSAAYKILFLICAAYYLVTQSIYPRLAASTGGARTRNNISKALGVVVIVGSAAALILWVFAHPILEIIYGSDLGATPLLRILVFAVPMDFVVALLGVSFTSRGFERYLLFSCGSAALCNLCSNLVLIPRMGAQGAAISTLISYVLLLIVLLIGFFIKPIFAEGLMIAHAPTGQE